MQLSWQEEKLFIKHLSKLKDLAEKIGLNIAEIKLRENTLEDVFIHLTGRNLRE